MFIVKNGQVFIDEALIPSAKIQGLAIPSHSRHQRNLKLIRLINFTHNSKGTPEGVPLPRGGDHAQNAKFLSFYRPSALV